MPVTSLSPAGQAQLILALEGPATVTRVGGPLSRRTTLSFSYITGIRTQERCSDVDPEDVVLTMELPAGTTFVEARRTLRGSNEPLPPTGISGTTVTWELGVLDALDNCFGTRVDVTLDADAVLASDQALDAIASIATSTAGDDTADNQVEVTFPAVLFPLDVEMVSTETRCTSETDGSDRMRDNGLGVTCGNVSVPPRAFGAAFSTDPPGSLGSIGDGPESHVRGRSLGAYGWSSGGNVRATASVSTALRVTNPNPFPVPLDVHYAAALHCRVRGAQATLRADTPSGSDEVECGYGNIDTMLETLFLHAHMRDPMDGGCDSVLFIVSDERDDVVDRGTDPSCTPPTAFAGAAANLAFGLEAGEANDDSGGYTGRAIWCISVSGRPCVLTFLWGLSVSAHSPVDLQITDSQGRRVGTFDDPDLGVVELAEIPGSSYTGSGSDPETIRLALPDPGGYRLGVVGTGEGAYTITTTAEDPTETVTTVETFSGEATGAMKLERQILVSNDGRVVLDRELTLEDVADHLLGAEALESSDLDYLDVLGNGNGDFDVGDFRAFLVSIGEIPAPTEER